MQEAIRSLQKPRLTATDYVQSDVAFHDCLARASGNILFPVLINSLNSAMVQVRLWAYRRDGLNVAERAVTYHSRILERVQQKDSEGAREAMAAHLADARATLDRVIKAGINSAEDADFSNCGRGGRRCWSS